MDAGPNITPEIDIDPDPASEAADAFANLPRIEDLPLPAVALIDRRWAPLMEEIADHIGAGSTLRFCEKYGGREIRVSPWHHRLQFCPTLTLEENFTFCHVFGRERINVPVATQAILAAKRSGVLALVRNGTLTIGQAAYICRTPRNYISELINRSSEGVGVEPADLSRTRTAALLSELTDVFAAELARAGIEPAAANVRSRLLASTTLSNMENAR